MPAVTLKKLYEAPGHKLPTRGLDEIALRRLGDHRLVEFLSASAGEEEEVLLTPSGIRWANTLWNIP